MTSSLHYSNDRPSNNSKVWYQLSPINNHGGLYIGPFGLSLFLLKLKIEFENTVAK